MSRNSINPSKYFFVSLLLLLASSLTQCNPNGAPKDACDDMIPGHDVDPQSAACPFVIKTNKKSYKNDETVTVTIGPIDPSADPAEMFKGFLIMARKTSSISSSSNSSSNLGEFIIPSPANDDDPVDAKLLKCKRSGDAVTHANREDKPKVSFQWIPDEGFKGDITFIGTVVKDYENFWTGIKSNRITITA